MRACVCLCMSVRLSVRLYVCMYVCMYVLMYTHTHTHAHKYTHTHMNKNTYTVDMLHTSTKIQKLSRFDSVIPSASVRPAPNCDVHVCMLLCTHARTHTHTHARTRTHACPQHTHTHAHTHTHTHTQSARTTWDPTTPPRLLTDMMTAYMVASMPIGHSRAASTRIGIVLIHPNIDRIALSPTQKAPSGM